ncbi:Vacuolar protein sorting-associated protein 45 [Wickerhamiella sorbophila]|uniref:Vacuolar protein sorting-associated protein 45 n=1 Tax=Wickerhamiella sorbophila TaxID=45607 RepID=A0A2T0FCS7_9ASCO|nr:Vacuolar protein sorting-associated protein 45 [Wickerhamiella sorbophila]PRT52808.1 Vacuolar protein sorting-associated protein 45 [Wickerhamiella sorbophila]
MDLNKVGEHYVQLMVAGGDNKARVLLLDKETTGMLSLISSQSTLLKNDIFLVDHLANASRQKMRHLDCICFVRPVSENIEKLVEELRSPRYSKYTLLFSNFVKKSHLERLAEADDHEAVVKVQELFCDYYTINRDFFSANCDYIYGVERDSWTPSGLDRSVESLMSVLLSLKIKPLIRFEENSAMSRRLAAELNRQIQQQEGVFDFPSRDTPPIVLIVDRRNDPYTPLLNHWTYQAMVGEIIGIQNNRVLLDQVPEIAEELQEVVLSQGQDSFFAEAMYLNFGDLGERIRDYVQQYQSKTQSSRQIQTVADMKRFVEEYPEFRKLSGNVSKHVTLVGELSRQVEANNLLAVSEFEQNLACSENHTRDARQLQEFVSSPAIPVHLKYRLLALYALRYEQHGQNAIHGVLQQIQPANETLRTGVVKLIQQYAGESFRGAGSTSNGVAEAGGSFLRKAQAGLKNLSLKGVDNVFTQHKSGLENALLLLAKGRLSKTRYPFFNPGDGSLPQWAIHGEETEHPQDVIVFMVGGATYEEARAVAEANAGPGRMRVVFGGTSVNHDLLSQVAQLTW